MRIRFSAFATPIVVLSVGITLLSPIRTAAQTTADSSAIRQAALDYVEGWYERDQKRVKQAVHPELAKRIVWRTGEQDRLSSQGADELVRRTGRGAAREPRVPEGKRRKLQGATQGPRAPEGKRRKDIEILDRYHNIAMVRVGSNEFVDYLHVAKWRGDWKIINILWDLRPGIREGQHPRMDQR
jgi:hypothetical protein